MPQRLGHLRQIGVLVHDPVEHGVRGAFAERGCAGQRVRGELAEREDIGGRPGRPARGLLGRHERRGADHESAARQ